MKEYLEKIARYLPMQFADEEANEFIKYLGDAYIENLEKEKYQFAFIAFHMLYMTFCFKTKWFLRKQKNKKIEESIETYLKANKKKFFNGLFDLSQFNEKDTIHHLLHSLDFDIVETEGHKKCIDIRNNCAHANGKIRYNQRKINTSIEEEVEFVEKIQSKLKTELKNFFQNFLDENWQQTFISGDIKAVFVDNYFSLKDLEQLMTITLPVFKKKSNNEKNIKQKIHYLLLIFEVQKQIEDEKNLFLDKLPIFMIDLPEIIPVVKDGDKTEIHTSEIIEEFLIPIISTFSADDRIEAEEILNLVE